MRARAAQADLRASGGVEVAGGERGARSPSSTKQAPAPPNVAVGRCPARSAATFAATTLARASANTPALGSDTLPSSRSDT
ncbi:MAG TPA: hypothetical protein DHU96_32130 [Actinobacteria bacterium]|nr:hypothetical protein [Actinomycetota bacterium]